MKSERLLTTFVDLVRLDNPSGKETAVMEYIRASLVPLGLTIEQDESLNVLARLPGSGDPLLLNAHTDSVRPCEGVRPVVAEGFVRSSGDTVLGADDLAGVAAILEGVRCVCETQTAHRAAEILFTTQEEVGLRGAHVFDYSRLRAQEGFTFDTTGDVGGLCLGAPSQANFTATIIGKAAHAGLAPEEGINAIQVAAAAIAPMKLGRIDEETTTNVGIIHGGDAINIVPSRVELQGEARSHTPAKLEAQIESITARLHDAAARANAQVDMALTRSYHAYRLAEDAPVVQYAAAALRRMGIEPYTFISGGGSDVNVFARHGLSVVNLSVGYRDIHTVGEHIAVADLERVAYLVEMLLTSEHI